MATLIKVVNLKKYFLFKEGVIHKRIKEIRAVDGITFEIKKGETFGLIGESGSGKTTTGRLILRLIEPTEGVVYYEGKNIFKATSKEMRRLRSELQIIFQDPYLSLNPRKTIRQILTLPFKIHTDLDESSIRDNIMEILQKVELDPKIFLDRYPHELSGGQRQRVAIARALCLNPKFVVADEPVSSLDVTTRSQILNLMKRLQKDFDLTYLFITHDLSVARFMCTRIAVMYSGKIVELAPSEKIYETPLHPYTKELLSSVLTPDPHKAKTKGIALAPETLSSESINFVSGCRFYPRCKYRQAECLKVEPELSEIEPDHFIACLLDKV